MLDTSNMLLDLLVNVKSEFKVYLLSPKMREKSLLYHLYLMFLVHIKMAFGLDRLDFSSIRSVSSGGDATCTTLLKQ